MADGFTFCHSATLISVPHVMVIIHHSLWLYGFYSLTAEITFCWNITNICQHANVSLVLPQYCHQFSPSSYANVSPFQFYCLRCQVLWDASPVQLNSPTTVNLSLCHVIK
jgi:hypothetical protein